MFDLIAAIILLVSALVGFVRGATRELVAVLAFITAALLAVLTLRFSTPIFHAFIATEWLARIAALIVVFLAVYIGLRLLGGFVTRKIHATSLGTLDRAIGLGFGLVRALVVLGLFNLVFHAATPRERTPAWVLDAKLYPLTAFCARVLTSLAPPGSALMQKVTPALERSLKTSGESSPDSDADKSDPNRYDPGDRKALDDLVEKSL